MNRMSRLTGLCHFIAVFVVNLMERPFYLYCYYGRVSISNQLAKHFRLLSKNDEQFYYIVCVLVAIKSYKQTYAVNKTVWIIVSLYAMFCTNFQTAVLIYQRLFDGKFSIICY